MEQARRSDDRAKFYLALALAVVLIPAALGSSKTIFNDGDVGWHIAAGNWIVDHQRVPSTDPFSFTWAGKPWVAFEWLAQVIIAAAHRLAGFSGIAALATAALVALHAIVFFSAARVVRPIIAVGVVAAMDLMLIPMTLARPHLLAWVLVAGWTWLMLRARDDDRAPPLAAALLMVVWANLHGSFAIGLVIAGAFGLEALLASADRARALRQWLVFGIACAIAVFINANGVEGVVHPLRVAELKTLVLIDEWKPSSPAVTPFFFVVLLATFVLIALKRPHMHAVRWVLLAALLGLALYQVRHQAILAIVSAMLLPQGFATSAERRAGPPAAAWLTAAAMGALVALRAILPISPAYNEANPGKLIAAVPAQLRGQPVLNGYSMGGPLIRSGIRPYIDGRSDMYGDEFVAGYKRMIDGDSAALAAAVERWNIRWAILPNRYAKLLAVLDRSRGWRRIYKDEVGVIYARTT